MARYVARIAKSLVAAVTAFGVPFAGALTASSDQGGTVTQGEWTTALVAAVVAGLAVWAVPNAQPPAGPGT
jgi:hypothetical protein